MYRFPLVSMHILCCLILLMPMSGLQARQVFDSTDSAFTNAITVNWPPTEWSANQTSLQFTRNGVSFLLQYNAPGQFDSLVTCTDFSGALGDGLAVYNPAGGGLTLTINPPVAAIAFNGSPNDGFPNGTFTGTTGNEPIQLSFTEPGPFYGAADIGDIASVSFVSGSSLFCLHDMAFVAASAPPAGSADLELAKGRITPVGGAANGETVVFSIDLDNLGPDPSEQVQLVDFVPTGWFPRTSLFDNASVPFDFDPLASVVRWDEGDLSASTGISETITITTPASRLDFSCRSRLLNIATTTANTSDPSLGNNLAFASVWFDDPALPTREVCDNLIDDDCDGSFDCADSDCNCWPSLPTPNGNDNGCNSGYPTGIVQVGDLIVTSNGCEVITDTDGNGRPEPGNPAGNHACQVPRGRCGGVTVPAFCCDVGTWSNPSAANLARVAASCDVGIPGCVPVDPNYKEAVPRTNIAGYGYIGAGETISYTIHYENIGDVNATDVRIIDVLDENLDDSTLAVSDEGLAWSFDPVTRALIWQDPLLPPATPRSVSFSIDMRDDAQPGTRARNEATILFPTADEPRTDTNFVEHVVPDPSSVLAADLSVLRCTPAQTPGEYLVELANQGMSFAYNVTATVIDAPQSVTVQQGTVSFAHPDDPDPTTLASVIPNAVTTSIDTLRLSSTHPIDPCEALTWQIDWETGEDEAMQRTITPAAGRTCDYNGDTSVDISDVRSLLGLRNQPTNASTLLDDLDGDGRITVLDARGCVLACDNPRCAPATR